MTADQIVVVAKSKSICKNFKNIDAYAAAVENGLGAAEGSSRLRRLVDEGDAYTLIATKDAKK